MKALITTLLALGIQAHATTGADIPETVMTCQPLINAAGLTEKITVETGGIAGLTYVEIHTYFSGHVGVKTYYVQEVQPTPGIVGAPVEYVGKGIDLTANFTTAPMNNGGHIGHLSIGGQETDLSCTHN